MDIEGIKNIKGIDVSKENIKYCLAKIKETACWDCRGDKCRNEREGEIEIDDNRIIYLSFCYACGYGYGNTMYCRCCLHYIEYSTYGNNPSVYIASKDNENLEGDLTEYLLCDKCFIKHFGFEEIKKYHDIIGNEDFLNYLKKGLIYCKKSADDLIESFNKDLKHVDYELKQKQYHDDYVKLSEKKEKLIEAKKKCIEESKILKDYNLFCNLF